MTTETPKTQDQLSLEEIKQWELEEEKREEEEEDLYDEAALLAENMSQVEIAQLTTKAMHYAVALAYEAKLSDSDYTLSDEARDELAATAVFLRMAIEKRNTQG